MAIIRPSTEASSFEKLKQLILFITKEGEDDPRLGAVKLNKLLYFAEVRSYLELGRPLTGVTFQRLPEGPAPRALVPARNELLEAGDLEMSTHWYLNQRQIRLTAKAEPRIEGLFDEAQLRIILEVISELRPKTAKEVSDISHDMWAWKLTDDYEDMPLSLAWLSSEPLSPEQLEHGQKLALQLNGA